MAKSRGRGFVLKNVEPVFKEVDESRLRAHTEFERLAKLIVPEVIAEGPEKSGTWKRGWKVMRPRQIKNGVKGKLQTRVPYARRVEFGKRKGGAPWSKKGHHLFTSKIRGVAMLIK